MEKKTFKKLLITFLSAVSACCLCLGIITNVNVSAENGETSSGFYMDYGASVKLDVGYTGLRFTSNVTESYYNSLMSTEGAASVEFGTAFIPRPDNGKDGSSAAIEIKCSTVPAFTADDGIEETFTFKAALANIDSSLYSARIEGHSYAKVLDAEGKQIGDTVWATQSDNVRAVREVAHAAILDDYTSDTTELGILNTFAPQGTATETVNGYVAADGKGAAYISGVSGSYSYAWIGSKRVAATVENGWTEFTLSASDYAIIENNKVKEYVSVFADDGKAYSTKVTYVNTAETLNGSDWIQTDGSGTINVAGLTSVDNIIINGVDVASQASVSENSVTLTLDADTLASLKMTRGGDYNVIVISGDKAYTTSVKYVTKAISTYADLAGLNDCVSSNKLSGYYYVVADIDAEGQSFARLNANMSSGHFDGGNHTISNLYCTSGYIIVGAYGGSTFKNVTFDNFKGQYLMQGNAGTIENVIIRYADQTAFNGLAQTNNATGVIKNCVVEASESAYVGASVSMLAGTNIGTIENCIANASAAQHESTKLVATEDEGSTMTGCTIYNAKTRGEMLEIVKTAYGDERAAMYASLEQTIILAGVNGWVEADATGMIKIEGLANVDKVTLNGKDITSYASVTADGVSLTMDTATLTSLALADGKDYAVTVISGKQTYSTSAKKVSYAISTWEEFDAMKPSSGYSLGGYWYVTQDIDCTGRNFAERNVNLNGFTLDGGYHKIIGLTNSTGSKNMFRNSYGATIKNIAFDNLNCVYLVQKASSGSITFENVVVRYADSISFNGLMLETNTATKITNCVVEASESAYVGASVSMLAGTNSGTIENCIANASASQYASTVFATTDNGTTTGSTIYNAKTRAEMLEIVKTAYGEDMATMYASLGTTTELEGVNGWLQVDGVGSIEIADLSSVSKVTVNGEDVTSYATVEDNAVSLALDSTVISALGLKTGSDYNVAVSSGAQRYTTSVKYVTKAISSYEDLVDLNSYVSNYKLSGYFYVVADIDAEGQSFVRLNANLSGGHFDGGNHTISNLYCANGYIMVGAFGGSTFKNVTFDNFKGQYLMQGNEGTIENVIIRYAEQTAFNGLALTNKDTGVIKNCVVEASESAYVGASVSMLAGTNIGTIENCIANASAAQHESTKLVATDNGTTTGCTVYNAKTSAEMLEIVKTAYGDEMAAMYAKLND